MKKAAILLSIFAFCISATYGITPKKDRAPSGKPKKEHGTEKILSKRSGGIYINPRSENNFILDFGNTPATGWEKSGNYDEVIFTKNGQEYRGFYDLDGNLIGTTSNVKISDLPANAQKEIQTKYKDYTVGKIIFFQERGTVANDIFLYGRRFEDSDNYFVELSKGDKKSLVQTNPKGDVIFYKHF